VNLNATLVAQFVVFFVLAWFTMTFVWPPLMRALDERARKIADGLASADRGQQALKEAELRIAAIEAEARQNAQAILAETEARAAAYLEQQRKAAEAEGARLVEQARVEIAQEVQRARDALRSEVATLAVAGARQILGREIDVAAHTELLKQLEARL
jgi:F-type H+-transporting ATPase subunit b